MELKKESVFFMVFIEGEQTPAYRHSTQELAEEECRRLVKRMKKKGFVLQVVKSIQLFPEFLENNFTEDLPF